VINSATKRSQAGAQVLLIPARTAEIDGQQLFFLFSTHQVAEVMKQAEVLPVPFAQGYVDGIAQWCGRVLPVLSLERLVGVHECDEKMPLRTIVVRSVSRGDSDQLHESYAICKVGAAIRHMTLVDVCQPVPMAEWVGNPGCLHGVYQMQARLVMVVNIEDILKAN